MASDTGTVVVIFRSRLRPDAVGYHEAAVRMEELAAEQPGYLGLHGVRDERTREGISVSYWSDEAAAQAWKANAEHLLEQLKSAAYYDMYAVEVATVVRSYDWSPAKRT